MTKPMPRLAPATNAVFPFKEKMLSKAFEPADWVCGGVLKPIESGEEIQLDCNIPPRRIRLTRAEPGMHAATENFRPVSVFPQPPMPVLRYDWYSHAIASHCSTGRRWCWPGSGSAS